MTQQLLDTDEIITELDISHIVIEDDTPVDNFQSEEQQRLLVELLYSSKVLSTGSEGQEVERQGREIERQRADQLAERLREMGIKPDEI